MSRPKITWHFDFRPGPNDKLAPMLVIEGDPPVHIWFNVTRSLLTIEYDGDYGTITLEEVTSSE